MAPAAPESGSELQLLRRLVKRIPGMTAYWDVDRRNVVANEAYAKWLGAEPEAIRGLHIREVLGKNLYLRVKRRIDAAYAGKMQVLEETHVDASGRSRHCQATYMPDTLDGEVVGVFVLLTDITARVTAERKVRQSMEQYRTLASNVPGSFVYLFDHELRFLTGGGPALEYFGLTPERVEGRTLSEVVPDHLEELEPLYRATLAGATMEWDRAVAGRAFHMRTTPVRDADGEIFAGMVVAVDVTTERRRQATYDALHRIAKASARRATPAEIFDVLAAELLQLFEPDVAGVFQLLPDREVVIVSVRPRPIPGFPRRFRFSPGDSHVAVQVIEQGRQTLVRYDENSVGFGRQAFESGLLVGIGAPVYVNGLLWGALALACATEGRLDEQALRDLGEFAELVEITLINAEAWDALAREATIDPLTQLPNRRAFEQRLEQEIATTRRTDRPLSVAVIDLDRFKDVNDRRGHAAGDRVLREAAQRMGSLVRANELVARIGGEEFAMVLPESDDAAAFDAAERLRTAIANSPFEDGLELTASVGVCTATGAGSALDLLVVTADDALYEAKASGRNTTHVTIAH